MIRYIHSSADEPFSLYIGTGIQGFIIIWTLGFCLLYIAVIEGGILAGMNKVPMVKAMLLSIIVNIFSAVLGFIFGFVFMAPIYFSGISLLIYGIWWFWKRREIPDWVSLWILITIFLIILPSLIVGMNNPNPYILFDDPMYGLAGMAFGLGLSIFIHGISLRKILNRNDVWKAVIIANLILFFIFIPITAIGASQMLGARRASWPSRAKGTLRFITTTQPEFKKQNPSHTYGTFQDLKNNMLIAEGYTLGNIIENYSMTWQVNNVSTVQSEEFPDGIMSTFTVIAFPRDTRPGFLNTFATTEDGVIRVYNPDVDSGNKFDSVKSWDPIL